MNSPFLSSPLHWCSLPPLPPLPGQGEQPGVAGAFAGVSDHALLVAGGTNFTDAPPWKGGTKRWWDTIHVLESPGGPWITQHLPAPLGYGISFATPHGLVCAGGAGPMGCSTEVFLLRWNRASKTLKTIPLPSLPEPMYLAGGGVADGQLFLACGQGTINHAEPTQRAYLLDLRESAKAGWKRLPDLPGEGRILPVSFGISGRGFFLMSGRRQIAGRPPELFQDAFRFDPTGERWITLRDTPACFMAGTAVPDGPDHALILGGDSGELFLKKEAIALRIQKLRASDGGAVLAKAISEEENLLENHPGFSRKIFRYDAAQDAWEPAGTLPEWPPVTVTAVWWADRLILPSGEIRPGIRTPAVWSGSSA